MKIVLISQNASPGLLIFRKELIRYLVLEGHDVYALAIDYNKKTKQAVSDLGAVPISYQLDKAGLNPLTDITDTFKLYRTLRTLAPDVVFSFFVKPSIYGTLAAKLAGVPRRIAMLEGLGHIYSMNGVGSSFRKRILQLLHGILCSVSYFFAEHILFLNQDDPVDLSRVALLSKDKLRVLGPIGLELQDYPFSEPDIDKPIRFIFVGRLLAEKGVFEYIEAARSVRLNYPEAEFVMLGGLDPDNPSALSESDLNKVIAEGMIQYPGHVSNVSEWVTGSHVFVLPSYREGLPRSTQEAMAIGRAVITSDAPGCRETVIDGVNGFIVRPWDDEALARKMKYLIKYPQEIMRMGRESHRIATERFDVHKITPLLAKLITG